MRFEGEVKQSKWRPYRQSDGRSKGTAAPFLAYHLKRRQLAEQALIFHINELLCQDPLARDKSRDIQSTLSA